MSILKLEPQIANNSANFTFGNVFASNFYYSNGTLYTTGGGGSGPAETAGTVTTNAQPNITSVGTLTSLTVTGNIIAGNANLGNLVVANFYSGNGSALSSITGSSVIGEVAYASTANSVAGSNVSGQVGNSLVAGTVYSNAQPNITSLGSLANLTVTGVSSFDGSVTTKYTDEALQTKTGATGTVTHDLTLGTTFYHTTPSANFTANFTNVSTTSDRVVVAALIIVQGATAYLPTSVQIDGTSQTIKWAGGTAPTGNASKIDIVSFSLLRTGSTWTVFGQSTDYS